MPAYEQYTEDATLTAIAIAYSNPAYALIADKVLPRKPVDDLSYRYTVYPEARHFTVPDTRIGRRSSVRTIELEGDEVSSKCEDYGLGIPLDNDTIMKAEKKGRDPRKDAVALSANLMLLDREVRVADLAFDAANYHANHKVQLAGTDQISDYHNSDPINLLKEMLDGCFMRPNRLVLGHTAWSSLSSHPAIVASVNRNAGDKGIATRQAVADLFEVQEVLVGVGRVNVNKPGQAANIGRIWGNHIAGLFIDETVTPDTGGMTFGLTAQYGGRVGGTKPLDIGLRGGLMVRAGESVDEVIIAKRAGFLIEDAVQE